MNSILEYGGDLCKSHSARSEKEFCRVCPSKLSKTELENVYFTLLESNLNLKTTINRQREQLKILSTKVQRLTALQRTYLGKEPKDCCGSKAIISEQKECISELRRSNQCLSERMRQMNIRLCSAKQYLQRSPFQSTSRCNRCNNKNASTSELATKRSDTNLRTAVGSSQYLVKEIVTSRSTDNIIVSHEKGVQFDFCEENKCRSTIEELQQKNDSLVEEVSKLKSEHAGASWRLQEEARGARARAAALAQRLASADRRRDELAVELSIEQRKVLELQTDLRAAEASARVVRAIETRLADGQPVVSSPAFKPRAAVRTRIPHSAPGDDAFRNSDDSGYTEANRSQEADDTRASTTPAHINQVLLEKIADLQNQVNKLKAFKNELSNTSDTINVTQERNETYNKQISKQKMDESVRSESSDSVITQITESKPNTKINVMKLSGNETNKIDPVAQVNKINLINTDDDKSKEIQDNTVDSQTSDFNADSKLKSYKQSEDENRESNTVIIGRKLSMQSSNNNVKNANLLKTGSLDENRTNLDEVEKRFVKKFETSVKLTTSSSKTQVNQSNSEMIKNNNDVVTSGKDNQLDVSATKTNNQRNNSYEENIKNESNDVTKDAIKKDSDSSKGTYSIHRDDDVVETKDKDIKRNKVRKHSTEIESHKNNLSTNANVKPILNRATSKDKSEPRRKSSTPSANRTYVKAVRDVSPDSTEREISSISDLPSERDARTTYDPSPGEERPLSASCSRETTTDCGSLSEGELPFLHDSTALSAGEMRVPYRTVKSHSVPMTSSRRMEDALAAVSQELARCTRLLTHRSLDAHEH